MTSRFDERRSNALPLATASGEGVAVVSERESDKHAQMRAARARPGPLRLVLQAAGFALGVAMLWWCAGQALAPANRAQIARLGDASAFAVVGLAALTLASLALNGLAFWAGVRPVHRLRVADVVATNALATFLNYLPFKLSVLVRVVIHHRRDGVPVLTIGAWFAAVAGVLLAVYTPLIGVSLWRRSIDGVWALVGGAGVLGALGALVLLARAFRGEAKRRFVAALLERRLERVGGRLLSRVVGSGALARLHAGLDMLASWPMVGLGGALRLGDLGVQATRFVVAASILGVPMTWQDAALAACTYFLIGVVSPAGQLGTREAGTSWFAGVLALAGGEDLAAVVLLVSAVESVVSLLAAGLACVWLRVDRLLRPGTSARTVEADGSSARPTLPQPRPLPCADETRPGPDQPDDRRS